MKKPSSLQKGLKFLFHLVVMRFHYLRNLTPARWEGRGGGGLKEKPHKLVRFRHQPIPPTWQAQGSTKLLLQIIWGRNHTPHNGKGSLAMKPHKFTRFRHQAPSPPYNVRLGALPRPISHMVVVMLHFQAPFYDPMA